jgi:hypothetical protein
MTGRHAAPRADTWPDTDAWLTLSCAGCLIAAVVAFVVMIAIVL